MQNTEYFEQPMPEVEHSAVAIDGIAIPTVKTEFISANILEVEVGTTGHCGGDSGHGGRTYFKMEDLSSTDMRVRVNNGEWIDLMSKGPVEIAFGGDCELDAFISALEFAVETLKQQC